METIDFYRLVEDDIYWLGEDRQHGETFVIASQSSLTPPTLWLARPRQGVEMLKQAPARFDAAGLTITQQIIAEPQVWRTAVIPIWAPRYLGSAAILRTVSLAALNSRS